MKSGLIVTIIMCLLVLNGCARASAEDNSDDHPKTVKLIQVKKQEIEHKIDMVGIIHPETSLSYASKIPGKVVNVYVEEGDQVSVGDLLFDIDSEDMVNHYDSIKLQSLQAREQLDLTQKAYDFEKKNYLNAKALFDCGSISSVNYDAVKLKYDQSLTSVEQATKQFKIAQIALESAKNNLEDTAVYSTMAGYISNVFIEDESYVTSGKPAVVISSEKQHVIFGITQEEITHFVVGDTIIANDYGRTFDCTVTQIASMPDSNTGLFEIVATIDQASYAMPIGKIIKGIKIKGIDRGVAVPLSAVMGGENAYVYIAREDIAIRKSIEIISSADGMALVKGIDHNEYIVSEGFTGLNENDRIQNLGEENW